MCTKHIVLHCYIHEHIHAILYEQGMEQHVASTTTRQRIERQLRIKRLWHNEESRDNQMGKWEATAH
jgi:hypothetical protein